MMVTDAVLAFPGILLALALIAVLGSSNGSIIVALATAYTPSVVRVVRGTVLSIREREFIDGFASIKDRVCFARANPKVRKRNSCLSHIL